MTTVTHLEYPDSVTIHQIASAYQYIPGNPPNKEGFLVFIKTADQYASIIEQTTLSLKAVISNQLVGYLIAYTWTELARQNKLDDPEISALVKHLPNPQLVTYIEQIAVHPHYLRHGLAQQMLDVIKSKVKGNPISAAIVTKPHLNQASWNFFVAKNQFQPISEIHRDGFTVAIITSH